MTSLSIAEVLERAADLIEPEGAWTQGVVARAVSGRWVRPWDKAATCWCILGALRHVTRGVTPASVYQNVLRALPTSSDDFDVIVISRWNDDPSRTQAEVVAKLREASALAREQGL